MLDGLDRVSWTELKQPPWNSPDAVPAALRALSVATDEPEGLEAYHRLLYALGNNHAGTYFPVAELVIPFLGELLDHPEGVVRETVLDVLVDLNGAFYPEPGFEKAAAGGSLQAAVRAELTELRSKILHRAAASPTGGREAELARLLLEEMEEKRTG